ncbi:hypothetical protein J3R74_001708 [Puniceicoccus vermicola]
MHPKILVFLLFCLMGINACGPSSEEEQEVADGSAGADISADTSTIPDRPGNKSPYYNNSSIPDIPLLASQVMKRAESLTEIEFAMVFVESVPADYTLETFAVELFDHWRIGRNHGGKGVLFLFVEDEGVLKIEVSYELEAVFPDAFCQSYQETIQTYFASEHFGDVLANSINNMVLRYLNPENESYLGQTAPRDSTSFSKSYLSGGGGISENDYFRNKIEKLEEVLSVDPGVVARYPASVSIHESFWNLVQSLEDGVTYPHLDVLTAGSQYKRYEYPESPTFLREKAADYANALPYEIVQKDDLAVIQFNRNAAELMLFRRGSDGKWRYDLSKSWGLASVSFDFSTYSITSYVRDHPWDFAFPDSSDQPQRIRFPELLEDDVDLFERMDRLKANIRGNPDEVQNYVDLSNLLFWELYWIRPAIEVAEAGLLRNPENKELRWLAIYARYRAPILKGIEPHFIALIEQTGGRSSIFDLYERFVESSDADPKKFNELRKKYAKP